MTFRVYLTQAATEDLQRLEDFLIARAVETGDWQDALNAMEAIKRELRILQTNPFTCRVADANPYERELIIPFGGTGYVALFHILSGSEVAVVALRHQREDDYH